MRRNQRRVTALAVLFILSIILIACGSQDPTPIKISTNGGTDVANSTQTSTDSNSNNTPGIQLYVEPDDSESIITKAINDAHISIWLEMYLLTDKKVISALESAAHRGID